MGYVNEPNILIAPTKGIKCLNFLLNILLAGLHTDTPFSLCLLAFLQPVSNIVY